MGTIYAWDKNKKNQPTSHIITPKPIGTPNVIERGVLKALRNNYVMDRTQTSENMRRRIRASIGMVSEDYLTKYVKRLARQKRGVAFIDAIDKHAHYLSVRFALDTAQIFDPIQRKRVTAILNAFEERADKEQKKEATASTESFVEVMVEGLKSTGLGIKKCLEITKLSRIGKKAYRERMFEEVKKMHSE